MNQPTLDEVCWEPLRAPAPTRSLSLDDLGHLDCHVVDTAELRRRWMMLLSRDHWLGPGPLAGKRLCYLVRSDTFGDVAGLSFSAPAFRLGARDAYIGWDEPTRARLLPRLVCNSRFALSRYLPIRNLASHVLALVLRRLVRDWEERHGERLALVETFIDRTRHHGGSYRAANWTYVGDTRGRGRNDIEHVHSRSIKAIYVYPLHPHWRKLLGVEQVPDYVPDTNDWARNEFAHLRLHDRRLKQRVITVARWFRQHADESMPDVLASRVALQATSRLFINRKVTLEGILSSHAIATQARCRTHQTVLVVQETATLIDNAHLQADGCGRVSGSATRVQNLITHNALAVTPDGTPLGLVDTQSRVRDVETAAWRRFGRPVDADDCSASRNWLASHHRASLLQLALEATRVISISDSDCDAVLLAALEPDAADVVTRVKHDRVLADSEQRSMYAFLADQDPIGLIELVVPQGDGAPVRTARLAIRCARLTIQPLKDSGDCPNMTLDAVEALETRPPPGVKPLHWTLLTTVPTATLDEARERIGWYMRRGDIAVYHRTLKSTCHLDHRLFGKAERLEACLAVDLVVAWQVMLGDRSASAERSAAMS